MRKTGLLLLSLMVLASGRLWAQTAIGTVRISFEIEPVTVMKVTSEAGGRTVRLGPISPSAEVPTQTLEISIVSNAHENYRIYHKLRPEITSDTGTTFPVEKLRFMVTPGDKGGRSEVPSFTAVPSEEVPIFVSSPEGGSDVFQILYTVESTELFSAGVYYGDIYIDLRME